MTKYNFEFFDFDDVIDLFRESANHDISDVFANQRPSDPFLAWCKVHEINPHRTKTLYNPDVRDRWQNAEDAENFFVPYIHYEYLISKLIKNTNKFGIGSIDLNTFRDDINDAIGISSWSIYWKKYEGVIYSLNESFVSLFLPYGVDGILTVFDSAYFDYEN